jgi:hypothetical protein
VRFKGMSRQPLVDIVGHLDIASELDIIVLLQLLALPPMDTHVSTYSELADLYIVDTKYLLLFARAKLENRKEFSDEVEAAEYKACSDE